MKSPINNERKKTMRLRSIESVAGFAFNPKLIGEILGKKPTTEVTLPRFVFDIPPMRSIPKKAENDLPPNVFVG